MTRYLFILSALILSFSQAAAAGRFPPPVDVPPGANCKECGMRIRSLGLRFVSEEINQNGRAEFFCDLGDMFTHYEFEGKRNQDAAIYVKDYPTGAWVPGREAFYLAGCQINTPMRYGILAFRDRESAEKFKKEMGGGGIYTFDGVLASKVHRR